MEFKQMKDDLFEITSPSCSFGKIVRATIEPERWRYDLEIQNVHGYHRIEGQVYSYREAMELMDKFYDVVGDVDESWITVV